MENRSFDHFLGWLPGADGRHDLRFVSAVNSNAYPNYPLAPDFQGCGYSDLDHGWDGWLVQHNDGKSTASCSGRRPGGNPGVTLAAANTFPAGYYTNVIATEPEGRARPARHRRARREVHDAGPLLLRVRRRDLPQPLYQHAGQTDRDHNSEVASTLPTIWDQLSPIPNSAASPTGGYYYRDSPFLALWASPAIEQSVFQCRRSFIPSPTPTPPQLRSPLARRSSRPARTAPCRTCATSIPPSTTREPGPPGTTTRWATSGSGSGHGRTVSRARRQRLPR